MRALARAIEIAAAAHAGQTDKVGEPYIAHPIRLMARFLKSGQEHLAIVAALHDVVEDSEWTLEQLLKEGFHADIVSAVGALTRHDGEEYLAYVERAARHPLARPVKEADLRDNSDEKRLSRLPEADQARLRRKYADAIEALSKP